MKNINIEEKKKISMAEIKELILIKYRRVMILSAVFLACVLITGITSYALAKSEGEAKKTFDKYVNSKYVRENTRDSVQPKKVIIPADDAVDAGKIENDIDSAEALWKETFTWSDKNSYDTCRNKLIEMFGEDSDVIQGIYRDPDYIPGLKMTVEGIRTYVTKVGADGNSYASDVRFSIPREKDGQVVAMELFMFYSVTPDGTIKDPSGYTIQDIERIQ